MLYVWLTEVHEHSEEHMNVPSSGRTNVVRLGSDFERVNYMHRMPKSWRTLLRGQKAHSWHRLRLSLEEHWLGHSTLLQ